MFKRVRLSLLAVVALGMSAVAYAATDATPRQIYDAAEAGHMAEAQQMIDQVLRDHPQNAKAHFIASELDARIGDLAAARQQLATAKQLDPTQTFTSAASLSALERQLTGIRPVARGQGPLALSPAAAVRRASIPWGWIIVLALGAVVLWNMFRSRPQSTSGAAYGPGTLPPGNPGMQPGYGPSYPPSGGPGLMGNLASGLAIGAGVAAGEELVRHVMDGRGEGGSESRTDFRDPPQNQDMGGADFGTQDGSSWGNDSSSSDSGWGGDSGGGGDWS